MIKIKIPRENKNEKKSNIVFFSILNSIFNSYFHKNIKYFVVGYLWSYIPQCQNIFMFSYIQICSYRPWVRHRNRKPPHTTRHIFVKYFFYSIISNKKMICVDCSPVITVKHIFLKFILYLQPFLTM
jgi:hypothetical protein